MGKFLASIKKEFLVLINDRVGLLLMFIMPILLVMIITIVQDSTFRLVNENNLGVIIINQDKGKQGDTLINQLENTGMFTIQQKNDLSNSQIQKILLGGNELIAIEIPEQFSANLLTKAKHTSMVMLSGFNLTNSQAKPSDLKMVPLVMYYDPVLQESFRLTVLSTVYTHLSILENRHLFEQLYAEMGFTTIPNDVKEQLTGGKFIINQIPASGSAGPAIPNSTQHNVPAWSIFAMFFMVISLGGNIVKERISGSFIRLQTIPTSFSLVLLSKVVMYMFVALSQLTIIFTLGKYLFVLIGLPALFMPTNGLGLFIVSLLSAMAAISFSMLVGTYAKTQEQANGFGATMVIILAAIGGIWVPSFVMPSYLQAIGKISPLHWCLEGYYTLFLKGGDWHLLTPALLFLIAFSLLCQLLIFIKLKIQNYI